MATFALMTSKEEAFDKTTHETAEEAYRTAQQTANRVDALSREQERLKQYVYSYVSYLPGRLTPKKEEENTDGKHEND
jgi:hypothetical protein